SSDVCSSDLLGKPGQGSQQLGRCRSDFAALAHLAEHGIDGVQCLQHDVHQFRLNPALALAQDVENVFGNVAAFDQLMQLEESGTAFYRVKAAKNRIEQGTVIRAAFQLHQLL